MKYRKNYTAFSLITRLRKKKIIKIRREVLKGLNPVTDELLENFLVQ